VSKQPQVVVTGAGLVTCLGLTARETWEGVITCRRAFGLMPALEQTIPAGQTGAQAAELPVDYMPEAVREVRYLRWAIEDAWKQSGLQAANLKPERVGVILGTTLHGIRQGGVYLRTGKHEPLEHFLSGSILEDVLADLPVNGPAITTCSACSSGLASIAMGMTLLRAGLLDAVIAGGYDPVSEYVYAGFNSLRLVASGDLRPFCRGRDGMKLGEGYSVVILERAQNARARTAPVLAELLGYGESSDAHHLTQPQPEGEGAAHAAHDALTMARDSAAFDARAIGLCSAHATATPNNDAAEFAAMGKALGDRLLETPVVAFKSHVGHTLGAAGATELILSILAMQEQLVPPTAAVTRDALEFPVRLECDRPRTADIAATMNMSLGFGGANTCMIAARGGQPLRGGYSRDIPQPTPYLRPVLITGVGVVAPGVIGNDALIARLSQSQAFTADAGGLTDEALAHLLNARRARRMSEYEKITLAATAEAFRDAGINDTPAFGATCGAILGSMLGSTSFSEAYYRQIVTEGITAANPMLFAEGVPNAAAAQLSMVFGIKGGCQTIIGTRTSGLEALWLAAVRIATGEWERAIVSAGEEHHGLANEIWRQWGYKAGPGFLGSAKADRGFFTASGAATIILESEVSAAERDRSPRGHVDARVGGAACARGVAGLTSASERLVRNLGPVESILVSSCGTWLDRVEAAAVSSATRHARASRMHTGSIEGYLPELLSAGPLAALAGVLLTRHSPARLFGPDGSAAKPVRSVGLLASDFAGLAAAVRVTIGDR
jgi:3-oxoacyl-[acyl-carrier-protein] synthase II